MADVESYNVVAASNTGQFPEGQAPSTVNDGGRQVQADIKIAHNRINGDITAGGTADALTAAFTPTHSAHVAGRVLVITAAAANTTTTPTFTLDALSAKTITKNGGQALVAGDIYGAGHELILKDAGTNYELLNPAFSYNLAAALNEAKGADIASATTTDIGAATGNFVDVTGTTTITGLGTVQAGTKRTVQFDGSLTLTYNATSLILPGNANIVTHAGDVAEFVSLGSGNWMCTNYFKKEPLTTTISGSAASSITVSGLDSAYLSGYAVDGIILGSSGASGAITLVINGDTTGGNYSYLRGILGATYSQGTGRLGTIVASGKYPISFTIHQDTTNNNVYAIGMISDIPTNADIVMFSVVYTVTEAITSIGLAGAGTTAIDVGSTLRVRRIV